MTLSFITEKPVMIAISNDHYSFDNHCMLLRLSWWSHKLFLAERLFRLSDLVVVLEYVLEAALLEYYPETAAHHQLKNRAFS